MITKMIIRHSFLMIDINGWRRLYNGQFCGNVHHLDNNKPDKLLQALSENLESLEDLDDTDAEVPPVAGK